jgi:DNA-binding PadR family transcriptional regulator
MGHHHHEHHEHGTGEEAARRGRGRSRWAGGPRWGAGAQPWVGPGGRRGRGAIRASVLLILADAPMHGYQIMQELADRSAGAWRPSPGAVYPALQRLEDAGLIRGDDTSDDRRIYHLTEEGRGIAERLKAEGVTPWESSDTTGAAYGELKREVGQLVRAVMQAARDGSPQQREKIQALLASTRRAVYRILGEEDADANADATGEHAATQDEAAG